MSEIKVGSRVRISEDHDNFPLWWGEITELTITGTMMVKLKNGELVYCDDDDLEAITPSLDCLLPGDVIVSEGDEAKVLEVGVNTFLRSLLNDYDEATGSWLTFEEAKAYGWKLKDQEEEPLKLTVSQVSEKYGRTVEIVKE